MAVLVTGGAGYIGSHTCVELLNAGEDIIVIDNFYNSKPKAIEAIKEITGRDFRFYENDCCDREALDRIFRENFITEVIHFAGYKAVGESCVKPIMYYETTSTQLLHLSKQCRNTAVRSSCSARVQRFTAYPIKYR